MNLADFFRLHRDEIINNAVNGLSRSHLKSYDRDSLDINRERLGLLFQLCISAVEKKSLMDMISYSEKIARERYEAGFDLHELHTAYNVLEESIWGKILNKVEPERLGEFLGLISTVLGAGKETLALTYVSLSSKVKAGTLDLSELFQR